jgi:hypothetical protein
MSSPALRYLLGGGAAEADACSVSAEGSVADAAPGAPAALVPSVWSPPLLPASSAVPLAGSSCAVLAASSAAAASTALSAVTPAAISSAARLASFGPAVEGSGGEGRKSYQASKRKAREVSFHGKWFTCAEPWGSVIFFPGNSWRQGRATSACACRASACRGSSCTDWLVSRGPCRRITPWLYSRGRRRVGDDLW